MYKLISQSGIPKWLKALLIILLTVTCVYWIGWFIYKILNGVRFILHWFTEKNIWWCFLGACLVVSVITMLILQFAMNIDIFGAIGNCFNNIFNSIRNGIADLIHSK